MRHWRLTASLLCGALAMAACGTDVPVEAKYPTDDDRPVGTLAAKNTQTYYEGNSLLGGDGIVLFGGPEYEAGRNDGGAGIGVNSFLWRASLDTLSFMPLTSADPFGGVIITDWYTPPQAPNERFKVSAFILDRTLRADGVRVSAFRQVQESPGNWIDAPVTDTMASDLENAILTRARQMRIRTLASQ